MVKSQRSLLTSLAIMAAALGLTYAPLPGSSSSPQTIVVVSGSELQPPLEALIETFHTQQSQIRIDLKVQGSLDMVNRFIDDQNDFQPTVLIPANEGTLKPTGTTVDGPSLGACLSQLPPTPGQNPPGCDRLGGAGQSPIPGWQI